MKYCTGYRHVGYDLGDSYIGGDKPRPQRCGRGPTRDAHGRTGQSWPPAKADVVATEPGPDMTTPTLVLRGVPEFQAVGNWTTSMLAKSFVDQQPRAHILIIRHCWMSLLLLKSSDIAGDTMFDALEEGEIADGGSE